MKFFCAILAILISVLTCMPCSDAESFSMQHSETTAMPGAGKEHSHQPHEEHSDLCSPFCHCACCTVAYALPTANAAAIAIRTVNTGKTFASYLQQHPAGVTLPIWQPPQLI